MKKTILLISGILLLSGCGSSSPQSFGGNCEVITSRIDSALVEVKASNGSRGSLEQLVSDFKTFESEIVDAEELALIKSIGLNAAWLVDYWSYPSKSRIYTVEKVSTDFLEDANNSLFKKCTE